MSLVFFISLVLFFYLDGQAKKYAHTHTHFGIEMLTNCLAQIERKKEKKRNNTMQTDLATYEECRERSTREAQQQQRQQQEQEQEYQQRNSHRISSNKINIFKFYKQKTQKCMANDGNDIICDRIGGE